MVALLLIVGSVSEASAAATVAQKCSNQFQKVAMCLSYATGKAETPTKECCESVKGMRDSEPECLCYVMQQANNGSDEIKKMGIQVAKLLQLPTACSLKNASASDCPSEYTSSLSLSPLSSFVTEDGVVFRFKVKIINVLVLV